MDITTVELDDGYLRSDVYYGTPDIFTGDAAELTAIMILASVASEESIELQWLECVSEVSATLDRLTIEGCVQQANEFLGHLYSIVSVDGRCSFVGKSAFPPQSYRANVSSQAHSGLRFGL